MIELKKTELEDKYNLNCHVNCPFFPTNMSNEISWEYNQEGIKIRKKPCRCICGYDGHVITDWVNNFCPYEEELKNKKMEEQL